jgi:hypothetical protein
MSGIFRGSEEELVERTLAAERHIEIVDAELAALHAERRALADQLEWERERRPRLLPQGFVLGGALLVIAPVGLLFLFFVGGVICGWWP